ncbi:tail fiber assembly protein [Salipiger sp. PrR007]|uniref:tail fiber assembly protein n=1 Tax=Salipiger sp. PrR007 TaxID=2706884 RepID=UPI0013B76BE5|nr:tail fiber assembly protein [Salipiger sp. PrR007]NDW31884.1 hypothetical protein [Salipiger sp. PrR007]
MATPFFITDTNSGNALITGWGEVQDGVTPSAPSGFYVVTPSRAIYDDFLARYATNTAAGYGYLTPSTSHSGAYFELYYAYASGLIAEATFSGGIPPAFGSLAEAGREERNARLLECDWTQLPDAKLTAANKAAFATYRQALRDVPAQSGFPNTIIWPTRPAEVKA